MEQHGYEGEDDAATRVPGAAEGFGAITDNEKKSLEKEIEAEASTSKTIEHTTMASDGNQQKEAENDETVKTPKKYNAKAVHHSARKLAKFDAWRKG